MTKVRGADQNIVKWTSRALCAIEEVHVHELWQGAITGRKVSEQELQHVTSVTSDSCKLIEFAKSLKYAIFDNNFVYASLTQRKS